MTREGLEPLSPETENLLATERNFPPASSRLRVRAVARARGAFLGADGASVRGFWQRRTSFLLVAALVTVFSAAAIAAWRGLRSPVEQPLIAASTASGARAIDARPLEPTVRSDEASRARVEAEVPPTMPRGGTVVATPRPSAPSEANALELGLLQRARAGVASGKFAAALEAIAEHQRRFPSGRLREERDALRINALAGLGRNDEARTYAKRFRERYPNSVLSSRIEERLGENP